MLDPLLPGAGGWEWWRRQKRLGDRNAGENIGRAGYRLAKLRRKSVKICDQSTVSVVGLEGAGGEATFGNLSVAASGGPARSLD